jgi:hypothetical protein
LVQSSHVSLPVSLTVTVLEPVRTREPLLAPEPESESEWDSVLVTVCWVETVPTETMGLSVLPVDGLVVSTGLFGAVVLSPVVARHKQVFVRNVGGAKRRTVCREAAMRA